MFRIHWRITTLYILVSLLTATIPLRAQAPTQVRVVPALTQINAGETTNVAVLVTGVTGMYGVDIIVRFDPMALEAAETSQWQQYVSVATGSFLDSGITTYNQADNVTGIAHYAMTQVSPSVAKSGDGQLFSFNLRARRSGGASMLTFMKAQLTNEYGTILATTAVDGEIVVGTDGAADLAQTSVPTASPWPTLNPGGSPIETPTPGAAPALTHTPTALPTLTAAAIPTGQTVTLTPTPSTGANVTQAAPLPTRNRGVTLTPTPQRIGPATISVSAELTATVVTITVTSSAQALPPGTAGAPTRSAEMTITRSISATDGVTATSTALPGGVGQSTSGPPRAQMSEDEKRAQLTRASVETLVLLALCGIGLVVSAAGIVIFKILTQPAACDANSPGV